MLYDKLNAATLRLAQEETSQGWNWRNLATKNYGHHQWNISPPYGTGDEKTYNLSQLRKKDPFKDEIPKKKRILPRSKNKTKIYKIDPKDFLER